MPAPDFVWPAGDVPSGYEGMSIAWGQGQDIQEAAPVQEFSVQALGDPFGASVPASLSWYSAAWWVVYGTLVTRK
jgi:hypothetical protein